MVQRLIPGRKANPSKERVREYSRGLSGAGYTMSGDELRDFAAWNDFYAACYGAYAYGANCGNLPEGTPCCHSAAVRWGKLLWPMLPSPTKCSYIRRCDRFGVYYQRRPVSCWDLGPLMECTCCPRVGRTPLQRVEFRTRCPCHSPDGNTVGQPLRLSRCMLCRRWVCMLCPGGYGHALGCRSRS